MPSNPTTAAAPIAWVAVREHAASSLTLGSLYHDRHQVTRSILTIEPSTRPTSPLRATSLEAAVVIAQSVVEREAMQGSYDRGRPPASAFAAVTQAADGSFHLSPVATGPGFGPAPRTWWGRDTHDVELRARNARGDVRAIVLNGLAPLLFAPGSRDLESTQRLPA